MAGIFCRPLMEGGGGCFLRIVMENVFRGLDCDGKQGKNRIVMESRGSRHRGDDRKYMLLRLYKDTNNQNLSNFLQ